MFEGLGNGRSTRLHTWESYRQEPYRAPSRTTAEFATTRSASIFSVMKGFRWVRVWPTKSVNFATTQLPSMGFRNGERIELHCWVKQGDGWLVPFSALQCPDHKSKPKSCGYNCDLHEYVCVPWCGGKWFYPNLSISVRIVRNAEGDAKQRSTAQSSFSVAHHFAQVLFLASKYFISVQPSRIHFILSHACTDTLQLVLHRILC